MGHFPNAILTCISSRKIILSMKTFLKYPLFSLPLLINSWMSHLDRWLGETSIAWSLDIFFEIFPVFFNFSLSGRKPLKISQIKQPSPQQSTFLCKETLLSELYTPDTKYTCS